MFLSFIWVLSLCVVRDGRGGNPIFFNDVQRYWHYLWEVLEMLPLAVNKPVNQSHSGGCCSGRLCKQELSLSLLHLLTSKLFVSADISGKLNSPESHWKSLRYSWVTTSPCVLQHNWIWFAFGVWQIVFFKSRQSLTVILWTSLAFGVPHLPKHFNALHLQAVFCLSSHQNLICQFDLRLNASSERGMLCFSREQITPVVFWSKPWWFSAVIKLWGSSRCVAAAISQADPGSFSCIAGSVEKKPEYSWTHDLRSTNHELSLRSHCEKKLFYYGPFMLKMLRTK